MKEKSAAAAASTTTKRRTHARRRSSGVNSIDSFHDIEKFLIRELPRKDLNSKEEGPGEEFICKPLTAVGGGEVNNLGRRSSQDNNKAEEEGKKKKRGLIIEDDIETFLVNTRTMLGNMFTTTTSQQKSVDNCDSTDLFLTNANKLSTTAAAADNNQPIIPMESIKKDRTKGQKKHSSQTHTINPGAVWVKGIDADNNDEDEMHHFHHERNNNNKEDGEEDMDITSIALPKYHRQMSVLSDIDISVFAEAVVDAESIYTDNGPTIIVMAKPDRQRKPRWLLFLLVSAMLALICISILYHKSKGIHHNKSSIPTTVIIDNDDDKNEEEIPSSPSLTILEMEDKSLETDSSINIGFRVTDKSLEETDTNNNNNNIGFKGEDKSQQLQTKNTNSMIGGWDLNIKDGTISPISSSKNDKDLVLGVTDNPQLILTKKGNPNQLKFSSKELKQIQQSNNSSILNGMGLQNSHLKPGKHKKWLYYEGSAITTTDADSSSSSYVMLEYVYQTFLVLRGFGNNNNDDNVNNNNMILDVMNWDISEGTLVNFIAPSEEKEETQFVPGGGRDWDLNIMDGTISPRLRPDLVLGYGERYIILTTKNSSQARRFQNLSNLQNGETIPLRFENNNNENNNNNGDDDETGIGIITTSQPQYFYQWIYIETKVVISSSKVNNRLLTVRYQNNRIFFLGGRNNVATFLVPFLLQIEEGTRVIFIEI